MQTHANDSTPMSPEVAFRSQSDADAQNALDRETDRLRRSADLRFGGDREAQLVHRCQLVAEACGTNPTTGEPYYTGTDVLGWLARAVAMDCEAPRLGPKQVERLARLELIPNARLRERYEELREEGELTAYSLAQKLGIFKSAQGRGKAPDASAVERMLGVVATPENGVLRMRLFIPYEKAVALAQALGMDYQDVGV